MIFALAMAVMAATGGASAACSGCSGGSALLSTLVGIAPECFTVCPSLCKPLDKKLAELNTTSGKAVRDSVCADTRELDCAFEIGLAKCEHMLSMSSNLGLDLPTSPAQWVDFKQKCSSSASSGSSESHKVGEGQPELDSGSDKEDDKSPNQHLR